MTDGARRVLDLFLDPPEEAEWRPVLRGVSRLAYGTLPPRIREMYGLPFGPAKRGRDARDLPVDPGDAAAPAAEVPLHRPVPGVTCCVSRGIEPRRRRGGAPPRRHPALSRTGAVTRRWPVRDSPAWRSTDIDGVLLDIDGVLADLVGADPRLDRGDGDGSGEQGSRSA